METFKAHNRLNRLQCFQSVVDIQRITRPDKRKEQYLVKLSELNNE